MTFDRPALQELFAGHVRSGVPLLGGWCTIPSLFAAEAMVMAGFDWICIDTQHGLIKGDVLAQMIVVCDLHRVPCIVRVGWNAPGEIMQALDLGAAGVIVPNVETAEEVTAATRACRYPPDGYRSWGLMRETPSSKKALQPANENTLCIPMIETAAAVGDLDRILQTPGLSAVFVGPNDLSLSTRGHISGANEDQEDGEVMTVIVESCKRANISVGIVCSPLDAPACAGRGFSLLGIAADAALLREAARASVEAARLSP